ncbi:MAG: lipase [Firmicutes bacterium]|nr:lipase [Bacillota bacterium]
MNFKKMITLMTISGVLLAVGTTSHAFAETNDTTVGSNATSKVIDVQVKKSLIKLISNVVYEQVHTLGYENVAMKMDVLKPQTKEKLPGVVFITGGGFIHANKDSYIQQRMELAEAGYVVASVEYRVAPTATFPQPLEDVKSAIRYLKEHAEEFNLDPNNIGVMGESAGGYLSAMVGTTNGTKTFDKGDNLNQNSDVKAAVDIYGLSDLTRVGSDFSKEIQDKHKSAGATEALWVDGSPIFGGKDGGILTDPEKATAANPMTYISKKSAPFLLMHGNKDTLVSPSQTEILNQALLDHRIESTRYIVNGAQHGGVYWVQPEVMNVVIDFFNKHLKAN